MLAPGSAKASRLVLVNLLAIPASLALIAFGSVRPAWALLTYNIYETTDGNVVAQTDGSLNLPPSLGQNLINFRGIFVASAIISTGAFGFTSVYRVFGPTSFDGTGSRTASSVSGISAFVIGRDSLFGIDPSYVSGRSIVSSATFSNTTLRGLGFTKTGLIGTWTLEGTGDQIQVVLTEVPGPLPLVGAGAAFAFSRRLRRRIAASQPATPPQV